MSSNKNVLSCRASSTFSSIIGNITSVMKNYILKGFPPNFFSDIYVDTFLPSTKIKEDLDTVFKYRLPALIISPRYEASNETTFDIIPYWRRAWHPIYREARYNYKNVFFDEDGGYFINSIEDRIKMNFDLKIKVQTLMTQLDVINYIRQSFDTRGYFFLNNIPLETEIPKTIIVYLMKEKGIDRYNPNLEDLEEFNTWLKTYSDGYIEIKKNLADGKDMYSYRYKTNILCKIEPPEADAVNKKNLIDEDALVTFRLSVEFWSPVNYVFETIKTDLTEPEPLDPIEYDKGNIVLNYSFNSFLEQVIEDKTLLIFQGFVTDVNIQIDTLDLTSVLSKELKDIINYNNENEIDNETLFKFKVFRDNYTLANNEFNFKWDELKLEIINPLFNMNYYVALYGNLAKLNETHKIVSNS
jgi:hypothetical protein